MKKMYLSLVIILLLSSNTFAQNDTTKVEQYCEILATGKLFSNKVTIDIDFGRQENFGVITELKMKQEN
ncbi:MAG: hypothetical protein ABI472_21310 [Ginsengibacter sp.]